MKHVMYNCPYVPAEWIEAHGIEARRITPENSHANDGFYAGAGICAYAAAFANMAALLEDAAAIIISSTCDQMRRLAADIEARSGRPVFLFHVPAATNSPSAMRIYLDELARLGRFLVRIGGTAPDAALLQDVMMRFNTRRDAIRACREYLSAREFTEALVAFQAKDEFVPDTKHTIAPRGGVPLALVGAPLTKADMILFDIIERAGGTVVLDATATGERALPRPFCSGAMDRDALRELADAYFGFLPDAFQRPNTRLYRWLEEICANRYVRGLIVRHYVWCDIWQAESQRLREWAKVPVLIIDNAEEDRNYVRVTTRIEAFMESLQ